MRDTSAVSTNFGWDFQVNAGIILLLENIDKFKSIRMESKVEDIEIHLLDDTKIYAQAKSIVRFDDYNNVKSNLEKALSTLCNASQKTDCYQIIFVTNTPNPLSNKNEMNQFVGGSVKLSYGSLSDKGKKQIDDVINKLEAEKGNRSFNYIDKLFIQVISFHGDDSKYRYRIMEDLVKIYLSEIHEKLIKHSKSILTIWQNELFKNGSISNQNIVKTRRDIHIPIIVADLESSSLEEIIDDLDLDLDEADAEELQTRYNELIHINVEDYSILTNIIKRFEEYKKKNSGLKRKEYISSFVNDKWNNFEKLLVFGNLRNQDIKTILTKVILYRTLNNRYRIQEILRVGE